MSVRDLTILGSSSQQPTRKRNHGGYLLRWNNEGLLFDPGEGTQRQFIFANIAPTCISHIFISHFHGDHCLGLGSILMRLNLDKVSHPIHCFYPASGKKYFDRLRYGTIYRESIQVIEHPVTTEGPVISESPFLIEARFLEHGIDNIGWRITEPDRRKYDREKLLKHQVQGLLVKKLERAGSIYIDQKQVFLEDVSRILPGDSIAVVSDTHPCTNAILLAKKAKLLLCESTYLESHRILAEKHHHLTAKQAAQIAKEAQAERLIVTHFSARYHNPVDFEREARTIFAKTDAAIDLKTFLIPRNG